MVGLCTLAKFHSSYQHIQYIQPFWHQNLKNVLKKYQLFQLKWNIEEEEKACGWGFPKRDGQDLLLLLYQSTASTITTAQEMDNSVLFVPLAYH